MNEQINRVEEKVQLLLKEFSLSQKEAQRLQKENSKLKEQLTLKTEENRQLQQKLDALRMQGGHSEDGSKKELEKRINIYLKDIDKCLALLHS